MELDMIVSVAFSGEPKSNVDHAAAKLQRAGYRVFVYRKNIATGLVRSTMSWRWSSRHPG
jgi:hypothetical protein